MKINIIGLVLLCVLTACVSKKEIHYLQDIDDQAQVNVPYQNPTIQPNDILKITVESIVPEAAVPYNKASSQNIQAQSIQLLQLEGYLVSISNTIVFPILGELSTANKTTYEFSEDIKQRLESGRHLIQPSVNVRLLNAKVTILGEVNVPGTYTFTEQNITLLQALGYAGDLNIRGKREDVLVTREVDGIRKVSHIDLTSSNFMNSEYYFIKPNDLIIVNANPPRVTESGYVKDIGTILTIASLALSVAVLLSR